MYRINILSSSVSNNRLCKDHDFDAEVGRIITELTKCYDEIKKVIGDDGKLQSLWCYKGSQYCRVQFIPMTKCKTFTGGAIYEDNQMYVHHRWGDFDVKKDGVYTTKHIEWYREFPKSEFCLDDVINYHEGGEERLTREKL